LGFFDAKLEERNYMNPVKPSWHYENDIAPNKLVAGLDEVGYGAWAGPVVCCALMVLNPKSLERWEHQIHDSKKLTAEKRLQIFRQVYRAKNNIIWSFGWGSPQDINQKNVLQATQEAMARAILRLKIPPQHILIDGNKTFTGLAIPMTPLVQGDQKSLSIALASIMAKVLRDRWMDRLSLSYPFYGWKSNKGYGTSEHQNALKQKGVTPQHRLYKPILSLLGGSTNQHLLPLL
jgi:ribonuclease HII